MLEIGDIFRYYHIDELWLGVIQRDGVNPETQVVQWLVPVLTSGNVFPILTRNQVTLFDKA